MKNKGKELAGKGRSGYNMRKEERVTELMYKACIFDLDGTIEDTVESIAHTANQVLEHFSLPAQPVEDYRYFAGDGADLMIERAMTAAGGDLGCLEEGQAMFRELFAKDPLYKVKAYDGMKETLTELKRRGAALAVFSNKPHGAAVKAVKAVYGKGFFQVIQGQEERLPRKPAPDGAWEVAHRLGVLPEECVYLGDTNTDMQTGNAAGMYTVGVLWGFRDRKELEENHARIIIEKPEEILTVYGGKYD